MTFLYNTGIALYRAAASIAAVRSRKIATMLSGQKETFERLAEARKTIAPDGFDLWVHAASLGEFEQGRPLMEHFRKERPESRILLSFFSPSGYEVRKNYPVADTVVYLPFDTPDAARKFISIANPRVAVFVKYEFWGNYISALSAQNIPTYLISAIFRPRQIFFRTWGGEFRNILRKYSHLFVQDERSKALLGNIGITNVTVAGDTRFDRVCDIMSASRNLPEIKSFCENSPFTFVAGSSWPHDEDLYMDWLHRHPEVKAICAPHEFNPERLGALLQRFGDGAMLYSRYLSEKPDPQKVRYLIIDCFGLLSSIYRYGDIAYIGGGFGAGIHNLNEAAVYSIPVVFGPRHDKFKEAADLIACGGGYTVSDISGGHRIFEKMLSDESVRRNAGQAAGKYIKDNVGATDKIIQTIFAS